VAERLAARGVILSDETVRRWCRQCGQADAHARRRRQPRPGDTWHLDEVVIPSNGRQHDRWRAVDQNGTVRAILVQPRRDQAAAVRFLRQLRSGLPYAPPVLVTDTRAGDGAARRALLPGVAQRRHTGLNNRAEHAHPPSRERERRLRRCTSPGHARRFLAADGPLDGHCRPRRHRLTGRSLSPDPGCTLRHLAGGHRHPGAGLRDHGAAPQHARAPTAPFIACSR